jgi:uncharacterized tellurite resistance protein B-like protein
MQINKITDNWTKKEFTAFVMLHIANADLILSSSELFVILEDVNEDEFGRIEMVWSKLNDFKRLQLIEEQRTKHYPGDEGKNQLIAEITKIATADDNFNIYEQNMIRMLKKIL